MAVPFEKLVAEDLNLGVGTVDVSMPAGGVATGHRINAETFGPSGLIYPLGGSLLTAIQNAAQADVIDPISFQLPAIDLSAFILDVFVTCRTDDPGTSVQPVLRDVTHGTNLGAGIASVAVADATQLFSIDGVSLPRSGPVCKLQILPGDAHAGVYCNGYVRLRFNVAAGIVFSATGSTTPGDVIFPLGGSLVLGQIGPGVADVIDAVTIKLPAISLGLYALDVVVTCRTDDAGTSVQPILRDVTNVATLGSGSVVAPLTNTTQMFTIPGASLPTNGPYCRLRLVPGNNGANVYGNGYARLYKA